MLRELRTPRLERCRGAEKLFGGREDAAPFAKSLRTGRWRDIERHFVRKLNVADSSATSRHLKNEDVKVIL
jgi:hypothetical protein